MRADGVVAGATVEDVVFGTENEGLGGPIAKDSVAPSATADGDRADDGPPRAWRLRPDVFATLAGPRWFAAELADITRNGVTQSYRMLGLQGTVLYNRANSDLDPAPRDYRIEFNACSPGSIPGRAATCSPSCD